MVWALQEWMGISWWRRAFLTTFDWNNDRKCGNSLTMKAMCIRNLFHQDRQCMENSTVTFWDKWGKTSSANVQTSGATTPGPCIMTAPRITRCSLCGGFWFLWRQQSPPTLPTYRTVPPVIFSYSWRQNWNSRDDVLTVLKRSTMNRRTWQRCCHKMTSSCASDHIKSCCDRCINAKGDCFEGDGGQ